MKKIIRKRLERYEAALIHAAREIAICGDKELGSSLETSISPITASKAKACINLGIDDLYEDVINYLTAKKLALNPYRTPMEPQSHEHIHT